MRFRILREYHTDTHIFTVVVLPLNNRGWCSDENDIANCNTSQHDEHLPGDIDIHSTNTKYTHTHMYSTHIMYTHQHTHQHTQYISYPDCVSAAKGFTTANILLQLLQH